MRLITDLALTRVLVLLIALCLTFSSLTTPIFAQQQNDDDGMDRITVSIQPYFWALPFWIAMEEGFFLELGLDVAYDVYSSGAPQIAAAVEDKSWDVGSAGCVPVVIGGLQGIELIAISDDESATNALVANVGGVNSWPPESLESTLISVTANSTGHYTALQCLEHEYPNTTNISFVYEPQSLVINSLQSNKNEELEVLQKKINYGALWAPNLYDFLDSSDGSSVICSADQVGATVTGGIMTRKEFGEEKPDVVARFLAAWIRGIGFMQNPIKREQTKTYLFEFNAVTLPGFEISDINIEKDFVLRPFFELDAQLEIFDRSFDGAGGVSTVDSWHKDVGRFMVERGIISTNPSVETYITDRYLKMIADNDTLSDFTIRSSADYIPAEGFDDAGQEQDSSAVLVRSTFLPGLVLGLSTLLLDLHFAFP